MSYKGIGQYSEDGVCSSSSSDIRTDNDMKTSVVYANVTGFTEKKMAFRTEYLFVVEVYWSNNQTTYVKRTYRDFVIFCKDIQDYFVRLDAESTSLSPVYIPHLEGTKLFLRNTRDLAETRELELHSFVKDLLHGNPMISNNNIVTTFFEHRPGDPVPYRHPPDGASEDDNSEAILFEK
ncbi:hypothetical protein ACJMK2_009405 [Sinanodonta woodiana]|uniref:PX domain-containing protein n=1 Tax=Sinanodonta woodiana TaxID=1069815 RepID=A0ABD3VDU3_SINWO